MEWPAHPPVGGGGVSQDLDNFWFSTEITVLPFFRKIEIFSGFTIKFTYNEN